MPPETVPEPWASFLSEIDAGALEQVELHCLGGFVVTVLYGLARPTADVDVLVIAPRGESERLVGLAGKGSALHRKHGLYLDLVTVVTVPEDYDQRMTEMFPGTFKHLRLFALDPYDIALSKLERNIQRDRDAGKTPRPDCAPQSRHIAKALRERTQALPCAPGEGGSDAPTLDGCHHRRLENEGLLEAPLTRSRHWTLTDFSFSAARLPDASV